MMEFTPGGILKRWKASTGQDFRGTLYCCRSPIEVSMASRSVVNRLQTTSACLGWSEDAGAFKSYRRRVFQVATRIGGHAYPDGSIYLGGWSEEGQRQGFGHLCLPDNSRYIGGFHKGLCSGLGVLIFPDGARYEGELMEGWFHGHGVFTRGDGMKYEGEFRGGKLWGWGLVTFRDNTHGFPRQEGFFQDCRLLRNRRCTEVIERAQKVAFLARMQAEL